MEDPEIFGHDLSDETTPVESDLGRYWSFGSKILSQSFEGLSQQSPSHLHSHSHSTHNHNESSAKSDRTTGYKPSDSDMDKLRSTLKQFVRDWSEEVYIPFSIAQGLHPINGLRYSGETRTRFMLQANEGRAARAFRCRCA